MDVKFWEILWAIAAPALMYVLGEAILFLIFSMIVLIAIWWTHKY